jgi:hypothetical protein
MVTGAAKNNQNTQQKEKHINVTDMTLSQKRKIFVNCLVEGGFVGFE